MNSDYKKYQRVAVLVDVQNVYYSARHIHGGRVHYKKLLEEAVDGRQLVRAIAYIVQTPEADQSTFREMLDHEGFEIKVKEVRVRSDGSMKADWDMGIAIDAISMADKLDVIVLVSGDGDFVDMVNLLKSRGVFVEVYSFEKSTNTDLIKVANRHFPMGAAHVIRASRPENQSAPDRRPAQNNHRPRPDNPPRTGGRPAQSRRMRPPLRASLPSGQGPTQPG